MNQAKEEEKTEGVDEVDENEMMIGDDQELLNRISDESQDALSRFPMGTSLLRGNGK